MPRVKKDVKRIRELAKSLEMDYHSLAEVFDAADIRVPASSPFMEESLRDYARMHSFLSYYAMQNGFRDLLGTDELASYSNGLYEQMFIFDAQYLAESQKR